MTNKIKILGQDYEINLTNEIWNDVLKGEAGLCDFENKKITLSKNHWQIDKIIRHELLHALFFEAGLQDSAYNEILIDFISVHIPKINELYEKIKDTIND